MPSTRFAAPRASSSLDILPGNNNNREHSQSKMDLSRSTVYQVDYTCVNAGKTVGATKRRIRWRFGFASAEAIDAGKSGPECRGEEHEIILNWSLTSGKRMVVVDGNELFVECKPYETTLEYSWEMRGGHVLKVRGSVTPKIWKDRKDSGEKQFDFWLDGKSFSDFTQIYNLGRTATRSATRTSLYDNAPVKQQSIPKSEQVDWPKQSFENNYTPTTVDSDQSTFDFASQYDPVPASDAAAPPPTFDQVMEANQTPVYTQPANTVAFEPLVPVQAAPAPAPVASPFDVDYQAPPSHAVINQSIMQEYQNAPNVVAPKLNAPDVAGETPSIPNSQEAIVPVFEGEETYIAPRLTLEEEELDQDDIDKLMKKLCNIEDITSEPQKKLTIMNNTEVTKKEDPTKSKPIAPVAVHYTGPQPSLNEIKVIRGSSSASTLSTSSKEVMKAPPGFIAQGAQAGAMVVHGSQNNQWNANGAPPLPRAVGFGVGAQMGQGYGEYTTHGSQQGVYASM